jgi:LacI family transcriptional regulator
MRLKELASELGLSQTTVSRALNGYPEVSESTRQRVNEAAGRLGYRPNASAIRLATGHVGAIGVALPLERSLHFGPHVSEFLSGIGERMAQDEIDILVSPISADDEIPVYRRLAASKRVDAVVLSAPTPDDPRLQLLTDLGMPFVLHGRVELDLPYAWLDIDNEGAFHRATSHLLDLGHRRIGMINGPGEQTFAIHRERGFRAALLERGITPDPRFIAAGRFTDEIGFRYAQLFLAQTPPPTAIIAGSMMTGLGGRHHPRTLARGACAARVEWAAACRQLTAQSVRLKNASTFSRIAGVSWWPIPGSVKISSCSGQPAWR